MHSKTKFIKQKRVSLTGDILKKLILKIYGRRTSELAAEVKLPYTLVYNLICGRINSLSVQDYNRIFGEPPPYQEPVRVDGTYFRDMVRLWLFFHDRTNKSDLYKEFYPEKKLRKVDYRIFTGEIKTVETKLQEIMEQKFLKLGFERTEIDEMIHELYKQDEPIRVPYETIKPVLDYIAENLNISPTRVLNQCVVRYESGELKTVSEKIYRDALKLKTKTKRSLISNSKFEVARLNEEIYGKREGFTLFSEVEKELEFLKKYGRKSARKYLGRSISHYKKLKLKRIASWRANRIREDCNELIKNNPSVKLNALPKPHLKMQIQKLALPLKLRIFSLSMTDEGDKAEKTFLESIYFRNKESDTGGFKNVPIDKAAYVLGMSQPAFDLLIAANSGIFKKIGIYDKKWHLPYDFLMRLKGRKEFSSIVLKYEWQSKKREADSYQ